MTSPMKCPKCKGKGYYTRVDPFLAVVTLGLTYLIDKGIRRKCNGCDGKGWIR